MLIATLIVSTLVLDVPGRPHDDLPVRLGRVTYIGTAVPSTLIGAIITARRPGNRIGIMMIGAGFAIALDQFSWNYFLYGHAHDFPGANIAGWLGNCMWTVPVALLLAALLVYPNGHLVSPRWRALAWATGAWTLVLLLLAALGEGVYSGPALVPARWCDKLLPEAWGDLASKTFYAFPVLLAGAVSSVLVRYRQADGEERAQIKWLAYAGSLVVTVWSFPPSQELGSWARVVANMVLWTISIAIGVAVLRYRLYDIDRIINRTILYSALTACIGGVYVLVVALLGALFKQSERGAFLAATTVIAVIATPLRARLQRGVDRLLYGQRGEPYAVISELGVRLSAALAPTAVSPMIVRTVARTLKLPYVAIELRQQDGFHTAAEHGTLGTEPVRLPLSHHGELLGRMVLGPRAPGEEFSAAELRLLQDLTRQAGLALHSARLTADLQRSRERLVAAREEERRRLRHDLHDGLGPTLAGVAYKLDGARITVENDVPQAVGLLEGLSADVRQAIAEIRRLVDGLRPPALDELGLLRAIETHAALYTTASHSFHPLAKRIEVEVCAPQELPPLSAAIEVAAYRIVTEALTNVVRHAGAEHCRIVLGLGNDADLQLEITDDGKGLAVDNSPGVGLTSMRERAAELGGSLTVGPGPAGGTRVAVYLPR
ncbi:GAF domain-containing sensor histidine kinase [Streptomyces sp. NPDC000151]|uniref:GAF domain-containing sensor histidine kinase n=1 Tax=Streptomyces sp. NPDC000151 TaxID=3154244 RepID=UPI003320A9B6